jgi:hypothetical protein
MKNISLKTTKNNIFLDKFSKIYLQFSLPNKAEKLQIFNLLLGLIRQGCLVECLLTKCRSHLSQIVGLTKCYGIHLYTHRSI